MVLPVLSSTCMIEHPPTSSTVETFSSCLSWLCSPSPLIIITKLEGCCSAHPRCARAVSQVVVERQYRRSVSCNVIARALAIGGVGGHYNYMYL